MEMKVTFKGLKEIEQAMKLLPAKLDNKLLNQGLLAGAKVTRNEARQRFLSLWHSVSGKLLNSIVAMRVKPMQYAASVIVRVSGARLVEKKLKKGQMGPNIGVWRGRKGYAFYWSFLEFGTSKLTGKSFMRSAFEAKKVESITVAIDTLRPAVQKAIADAGKGV